MKSKETIKRFVGVRVRHEVDGTLLPQTIVMDGHTFYIDRVLSQKEVLTSYLKEHIRQYEIVIGKRKTNLYWDGERWFVKAFVRPS